jgi:hypothetical protein
MSSTDWKKTAEPRQDLLGDDGLDQEQQEGAEEYRYSVKQHEKSVEC